MDFISTSITIHSIEPQRVYAFGIRKSINIYIYFKHLAQDNTSSTHNVYIQVTDTQHTLHENNIKEVMSEHGKHFNTYLS